MTDNQVTWLRALLYEIGGSSKSKLIDRVWKELQSTGALDTVPVAHNRLRTHQIQPGED